MAKKNNLHLPDLIIQGFRGIDSLTIPRLGRVTLITGKNGIGKTTILEAVQTYASRADASVLSSLLANREEDDRIVDDEGVEHKIIPWEALFHRLDITEHRTISIGPSDGDHIRILRNTEWHHVDDEDIEIPIYGVQFRGTSEWGYDVENGNWPKIRCVFLGMNLLNKGELNEMWAGIDMTAGEDVVLDALGILLNGTIGRVTVHKRPSGFSETQDGLTAIRFKGSDAPVPLRSLGDGVSRLFAVAAALVNTRNGFLLIDEAESGLHYSVHPAFWTMVLRVASKYNVQVLATTHSWDCIRGFAQAAQECEGAEGILVRLEKDAGGLQAVTYSEKNLIIAAEQDIEVR